jgi:hypothetical protein
VIEVAVRVNHRDDGLIRPVPAVEVDGGLRRLDQDQRVEDDEPGISLDDRHVGGVEAADLIDPIGDLEQAVRQVEPGLPPQAGVNRGRRPLAVEEPIGAEIPDDAAVGRLEADVWQRRDEAAARNFEVLSVSERQLLARIVMHRLGDRGRFLGGVP